MYLTLLVGLSRQCLVVFALVLLFPIPALQLFLSRFPIFPLDILYLTLTAENQTSAGDLEKCNQLARYSNSLLVLRFALLGQKSRVLLRTQTAFGAAFI